MQITCDRCPKCGSEQTRVLGAVRLRSVGLKSRRRECICGYKWGTLEISFRNIRELRDFVKANRKEQK